MQIFITRTRNSQESSKPIPNFCWLDAGMIIKYANFLIARGKETVWLFPWRFLDVLAIDRILERELSQTQKSVIRAANRTLETIPVIGEWLDKDLKVI